MHRNYACPGGLPPGVTSVSDCSAALGTLNYTVGTSVVATINSATNQITAEQPGTTVITASVAGSGSSAGYFSTCPPKSIKVLWRTAHERHRHPGCAAEPDDHRDRHERQCHHRSLSGLPVHQSARHRPAPAAASRHPSPAWLRSTPSASRPPAIHLRSMRSACQWHRPLDLNQSGRCHRSRHRQRLRLVLGARPVAVLRSRRVADRHGGLDGAPALCAEFDGDGPDRQQSLLRFVARADDLTAPSTTRSAKQDTNGPGVVLAVSPDNQTLLINDQVRQVFYIYNTTSGSITPPLAAWASRSLDAGLEDAVHHRQRGAGRRPHRHAVCLQREHRLDDMLSRPALRTATPPARRTWLSPFPAWAPISAAAPTVAHTWCPSGTVGNYASIVFYPQGVLGRARRPTCWLPRPTAHHILGAAFAGGGITLSDIGVTIPTTTGRMDPDAGAVLRHFRWRSLAAHALRTH